MKFRSSLALFFFATVFLLAACLVNVSVEKVTVFLVGVPTLALAFLVARFAKIGKYAAILPLTVGVWFLGRMQSSPGYDPSEVLNWTIVWLTVSVIAILLMRDKKVVENPITTPARALDMAGFQEEAKVSFPWGKPKRT